MVLDFSDLSHPFAYSFIEQIPTQDLQCAVTGGDFNLAGAPPCGSWVRNVEGRQVTPC